MREATFDSTVAWGTVIVALVILVTPAMVHWRLRHGKPVDVGIWRLIGLHQSDRRSRPTPYWGCRNWHVGWAHGVWWLYFIAVALVWVVLRLFGGIRQ